MGKGVGTRWPGWGGPSRARPRPSDGRFAAAAGRHGSRGRIKHKTGVGHECSWGRQGALRCRNHGPGLMQEVKEEKSGEAGKQSDRQGRQRVSQSRGGREQLPQRRKQKKQPQPPALPHSTLTAGWADALRAPCLWARGPGRPCPKSAANQGGLGRSGGRASAGLHPDPPTQPHSLQSRA